jgi:hypothetical protein
MSKGGYYYRAPRQAMPPRCLGCHRPIFYGDRCEACKRELRQRRRRKPR